MKYSWRNMERYRDKYLDLMSRSSSLIVLDTETTGIGAKAKVIQFAAIRYKIKDNFSLEEDAAVNILINPGEKLSEKIIADPNLRFFLLFFFSHSFREHIYIIYIFIFPCIFLHHLPLQIHQVNSLEELLCPAGCSTAP